jgi:ribosomal protein S19
MSRSKYKLPVSKLKFSKNKKFIKKKIFFKGETITRHLFDKEIEVYNGMRNIKVRIQPEMEGKKLGSLITTRKICIYKKKTVKKNKDKK